MALKGEPTSEQKDAVPSIANLYDAEAIEVLVTFLKERENSVIPLLPGLNRDVFAADIIRHLESKTPQGMEFLRIWRKMDSIPLENDSEDGKLERELNGLVKKLRELAKTIT